jgi:hypothetical protein
MFASSFTAFFPEFSARGFPRRIFPFFFWMMDFSLFRLLSSFSRSRRPVVCIFRARAVCDHRALAPRETPQIAKSKRVILISRE